MIDLEAIARRYGGRVCNGNALIPTPGHSTRDRGTAIKPNVLAPDGVLVTCYNGGRADALAVKTMLRRDGYLATGFAPAREVMPAERAAIRQVEKARQQQREATERAAAQAAADFWTKSTRANPDHAYLQAKRLEPFGVRQSGRELLVPMMDGAFRIWNVQRIRPDGFKLFGKDARTKGLFWPHGAHQPDGSPLVGPLVIGEGYATMAAIHMATGHGVIAALSASNLLAVGRIMRRLFPNRQLVIAADDDAHLAQNKGIEAAGKVARAVGACLAVPVPAGPERDSQARAVDFADLPRNQVAERIAAALAGE